MEPPADRNEPRDLEDLGEAVRRLAREADWLTLMIEWDHARVRYLPKGPARPIFGVRTPERTKTGRPPAPPCLPVPAGEALAA